jgi:hypothetical protein
MRMARARKQGWGLDDRGADPRDPLGAGESNRSDIGSFVTSLFVRKFLLFEIVLSMHFPFNSVVGSLTQQGLKRFTVFAPPIASRMDLSPILVLEESIMAVHSADAMGEQE